jgi:hypothetical protein
MIIEESILKENFKGNIFDTAAELSVSVQTIMASLKKHNMKFNKPKHIYGELKRTSFSDFQKSILIGSILGDGHLEKRNHLKNALFREDHAINQIEWLKWKYNNLKPFTTSEMWVRDRGSKALMPDGNGGKREYNIQKVCSFSTGVHPYLTYLHGLFYENGCKVLPKDFINDNFDLVSLAVLIGDDGNFCENSVRICTDNFKKDDVFFLADIFSRYYNSRITIREEKKDKFRIVFTSVKQDIEFFGKIKNILPFCMHHKVTPVLNEHQVATHLNE